MKKIFYKLFKTNDDAEIAKKTNTLKRFFSDMIKPNRFKILISLVLMGIFAGANAGMAYLIKPIMNQVFVIKDMSSIYKVSSFLILLTLLKTLSQYLSTNILGAVSIKVISDARYNLYKKFLSQDMYFFHQNSPGTLMSVIINDINAINTLATDIPINLGRDLLTFIFLVGVIIFQEPTYAFVIIASIVFIVLPIRMVGKKIKHYFSQNNLGFAHLTSHLEQAFNGIREVKSYNMEEKEVQNLHTTLKSMIKVQLRIRRLSTILPSVMELLGGISVALILLYGGYAVIHKGANPGTFFSFIAALLLAYQPLKRLTEVNVKIQMATMALQRYYVFLDTQSKIIEKKRC
jgi:ATP-binding cassette, subfamily B, bacterial MsbA